MPYFNDPEVLLQNEYEEVQDDVGRKEKEIRNMKREIEDLEKRKELAEGELADLMEEEKRVKRELDKILMGLE